jgi:hypothetical protein
VAQGKKESRCVRACVCVCVCRGGGQGMKEKDTQIKEQVAGVAQSV